MSFITYPRTANDGMNAIPPEVLALLSDTEKAALHDRFDRAARNQYGVVVALDLIRAMVMERSSKHADYLMRVTARQLSHPGNGKTPAEVVTYHRTGAQVMKGFQFQRVEFEKKDRTIYVTQREKEFEKAKKPWLKEIATQHGDTLKRAGISQAGLDRMISEGKPPKGWQVHHRLPLDDGGTNDRTNFILIKDQVSHRSVHGYYNPHELIAKTLDVGDMHVVAYPVPPSDTVVYPNPDKGYTCETVGIERLVEYFDVPDTGDTTP
jgi:hypothetical protein